MAVQKNAGRQGLMVAEVVIDFDDIPTTATYYEAINMPPGARVVGGGLYVLSPWLTVTTATLSIGDADLATRYATTKDLEAAAGTHYPFDAIATTGTKNIGVTYAFTGSAATAGSARLYVEYFVDGRATEVQ
jgi:hypothetical protein